MSRPGPPHGEPPRPYDWQRQFQQPDFGRQQQRPEQFRQQQPPQQPYDPRYDQSHGDRRGGGYTQQYEPGYQPDPTPDYGPGPGYDDRGYGPGHEQGPPQGYDDRGYDNRGYDHGFGGGHDDRGGYDDRGYDQGYGGPTPQEMYPDRGRGVRLPGFGLVLSLLGIAVQLACMLVLPWVSASAAGGKSLTLPQLWDLATEARPRRASWRAVSLPSPLLPPVTSTSSLTMPPRMDGNILP